MSGRQIKPPARAKGVAIALFRADLVPNLSAANALVLR